MRRSPSVALLVLVAGCGGAGEERGASRDAPTSYESTPDAAAMEEAEMQSAPGASRAGGPNVGPTAAPGVAFNYRYAFRLPAERIAQVQEQHARGCEELGVSRCRITGMHYRVINERDIEAMLAFKVDPTIARRFGHAGVEAVARSEGSLVESEISGTDVGTGIRAAGRSIAEMTEELNRIEARLAQRSLPSVERQRLEYDAQQLRQSIRAQQANREQQQEALASTPMVFHYGSGSLVPGRGAAPSFREAAQNAWDNFLGGLLILFIVVVTLLPWALAALALWGIARLIRRWLRRRQEAEAAAVPNDPELSPQLAE